MLQAEQTGELREGVEPSPRHRAGPVLGVEALREEHVAPCGVQGGENGRQEERRSRTELQGQTAERRAGDRYPRRTSRPPARSTARCLGRRRVAQVREQRGHVARRDAVDHTPEEQERKGVGEAEQRMAGRGAHEAEQEYRAAADRVAQRPERRRGEEGAERIGRAQQANHRSHMGGIAVEPCSEGRGSPGRPARCRPRSGKPRLKEEERPGAQIRAGMAVDGARHAATVTTPRRLRLNKPRHGSAARWWRARGQVSAQCLPLEERLARCRRAVSGAAPRRRTRRGSCS